MADRSCSSSFVSAGNPFSGEMRDESPGRVRCEGEIETRISGLFLLRLGHKLVTQAAHREQMFWFGGVLLDVSPQANDKIIHRASISVFVEIPHLLEDLLTAYGTPGIADQIAQQIQFHERELIDLVTAAKLQTLEIDEFVAKAELVVRLGLRDGGRFRCGLQPSLAAEQAANSGQKNIKVEGFGKIVVGPTLKAFEHVLRAAARGQHEQRDIVL